MNELHIQETMTSLQIAEVTGKMHKHVLDAIRTMEPAWEKVNGTKFRLVEYKDAKGEMRPCYSLTKTECLYIATKFNDEARAKLILRWEELEQEAVAKALPRSYKEALEALLEEVNKREALEAESQRKSEQLDAQAPKVAFADAMLASKTCCLIGELAKILTQNGYETGQKRLFKWLRENGYLGKSGEYRNIPQQRYIEQGLFELKKGVRTDSDGVLHTTVTTVVTPKGQSYFINKFIPQCNLQAE